MSITLVSDNVNFINFDGWVAVNCFVFVSPLTALTVLVSLYWLVKPVAAVEWTTSVSFDDDIVKSTSSKVSKIIFESCVDVIDNPFSKTPAVA